jgi:hypothetical protein
MSADVGGQVFHETEIGGISFKATLMDERLFLRAEDPDGRTAEIELAGSPVDRLLQDEAWNFYRRALGPGWSVSNAGPDEVRVHLDRLSDGQKALLAREFGLHLDFGEDITFAASAAGQALKRIATEDPERDAFFRKNAGWLDTWLGAVSN